METFPLKRAVCEGMQNKSNKMCDNPETDRGPDRYFPCPVLLRPNPFQEKGWAGWHLDSCWRQEFNSTFGFPQSRHEISCFIYCARGNVESIIPEKKYCWKQCPQNLNIYLYIFLIFRLFITFEMQNWYYEDEPQGAKINNIRNSSQCQPIALKRI